MVFLVFLLACKNEKTPTVHDPPPPIPPMADSSIPGAKEFEQAAKANAVANGIDKLCAESKGYKSMEWEGLNDCSWVLEKERLKKDASLVQRIGDVLKFKMSNGTYNINHKTNAATNETTYFQYLGYLTEPAAFVIKQIQTEGCHKYWFLPQNGEEKSALKGQLSFNPGKTAFIQFGTKKECLELIRFCTITKEGYEKHDELTIEGGWHPQEAFSTSDKSWILKEKQESSEEIRYRSLNF